MYYSVLAIALTVLRTHGLREYIFYIKLHLRLAEFRFLEFVDLDQLSHRQVEQDVLGSTGNPHSRDLTVDRCVVSYMDRQRQKILE